jgi:acetoin utilization deacetylase AcuC-like enzyme
VRRGVTVFYRDEYVYDALEAGFRHAYDVQKPRRIRDALVADGCASPEEFVAPPMIGDDELRLVHTPAYLAEIRKPDRLASLLLLDSEHPWDEHLLEPFLYAAGGTMAATDRALSERSITFNLGGGFHHAQADKAEGFCAIADVAIAIRALQRQRRIERALIVDLDCHHGNGNAEIFSTDESVFTFSMHTGNWCWITKRHNRDVVLPPGTSDDAYLDRLREELTAIFAGFAPDFAVYVAGSDPYVGDTLGDLALTEWGLLERDRLVTAEVSCRGVPMAVVTAGGYGPDSWRIHFNYARWLLREWRHGR